MATTIENLVLKVKVDGQKAIDGLSNSVKNLSDDVAAFGASGGAFSNTLGSIIGKLGPLGLAVAAAGSAISALGLKAVQIAGELTDIADATGISTGAMLNFKQSVIDAGGGADSFSKMAAKLSVSIGEANSGNEKFQESFKQLGVTVRDANGNLRPTETILQEVLRSLSGISDPASRASRAVELLGKEAAKLDLTNLNAATDAETTRYIANLDKVNQAVDKIRNSLERNVVNLFGGALDRFDAAQKSAAQREAEANSRGKTIFRDPRTGVEAEMDMTKRERQRYELNKKIEEGEAEHQREMSRLRKLGQVATGPEAGGDFGARSEAGIKAAADSARRAQQSILEAEKSAALQGLSEIGRIRRQAEFDIQKEILNIRSQDKLTDPEKEAEIAAKSREIRARADLQVADALEQQRRQLKALGTEFERQQGLIRNRLDLETELVGKSEEQSQQIRAQRQLAMDYMAAQEALIKQRDALGRGEVAQTAKINELIQANADAYNQQVEELNRSITANQAANILEKDRLSTIERITQAYEQQQRVQESLGNTQRSLITQQQAVDFESAQQGRSPMERQFAQIKESARLAALEASRAFAAAFEENGDGMTPERAAQFAQGLKTIEEGYVAIANAQAANLEKSRTFEAGWREAFASYRDSAMNAADQASTYFNTFTRGFEDAFVRFVQTGKLSFKDLANSIIADFVRIQAKQIALSLFGGGNPLSSIFGGFRAAGGPVSSNVPYIVGEKGPEMFVPRNAGTIIPNNKLSTQTPQSTTVNYNIQAVDAASFRQMVARDPEFLYAVTERGRSSIPGGRR